MPGGNVQPIRPQQRKYLGGKDPDWLLTAAKQVQQMQEHPGWGALRELVDAQTGGLEHQLIYTHKPHDHATYAYVTGQIRGLTALQKAASDLASEAARILEERERQTAAEGR